jgi:hypothetical protein
MQNCDAINFYVDIIIEYRNSYRLTTNDCFIEHYQQTAEQFFDYMDDEQLEWLDGNISFYRHGVMEMYASKIIALHQRKPLRVNPDQLAIAIALNETGEFPDYFWTDVSKQTAVRLGFFPRISSHGFLTAQIIRKEGVFDEIEHYFYYCLHSYNQKTAIEFFNLNGLLEPK